MIKIEGNIVEYLWAEFAERQLSSYSNDPTVQQVMKIVFVNGIESMFKFMNSLPNEALTQQDINQISLQVRQEIREILIEHDLTNLTKVDADHD